MEVKNLYTKNYKILMKKIKKKRTSEKTPCVHGLEELKLLKCLYYPKLHTDSVQSLPKF